SLRLPRRRTHARGARRRGLGAGGRIFSQDYGTIGNFAAGPAPIRAAWMIATQAPKRPRRTRQAPPGRLVIMPRQLARGLPILQRQVHHPALAELAGGGAVDLFPGGLRLRLLRWVLGLAPRDRRLVDQRVAGPLVEVDPHGIAGAQPRQPAADGAFRAGVEDRGAVRGARLAPVAERRQPLDTAPDQRV